MNYMERLDKINKGFKEISSIHNPKVGDIVQARFTNIGKIFIFKAKIVKVNNSSVRVISLEDNNPQGYPKDKEFVIDLYKGGNNGIFEL